MSRRDLGSGVSPNGITTAGWFTQWLEERVNDGKFGSAVEYNYRSIIRNHLTPAFGSVHLQDLRVADIRDLKTRLPQSLQPGTTKKILGLIHHALQSAVKQELLATNPASAVPMPSPKHGKRNAGRSMGARARNCSGSRTNTPYDMPIRLALATGARLAEVLGATWGAIDVERGTFHVIKTLKIEKREFRMAPRRRTARAARSNSPVRLCNCCLIIATSRTLRGSTSARGGRITISCSPLSAVGTGTA